MGSRTRPGMTMRDMQGRNMNQPASVLFSSKSAYDPTDSHTLSVLVQNETRVSRASSACVPGASTT